MHFQLHPYIVARGESLVARDSLVIDHRHQKREAEGGTLRNTSRHN